MRVFDPFLSKYPPGNDLRKPAAETLEQFQGKVPEELLNFWQEYGFGNYGGGLLKIIDPTDYVDTLTLWLGKQEGCFPILMTGFGTLFIYRKLSETADDMCLLDIHNRRSGSFSTSFSDFFEQIIPSENFAEQFLRADLFQEARAEHSDDTESDDMWQQAYEANPHVFELDNGGLMVSFTFSETVDTILPTAPETMYEIDGENISLWALAFFSLTKDENLGFLEYHKALQRLQPYIVETKEDYILIRGLSLAEMEYVLAEK